MENFKFNTPEELIADIKAGKMIVVTDDANRENEGDLVAAAECITPEQIAFMATHACGLICAPLDPETAASIGLISVIGGAWLVIGVCYIAERVKKRKKTDKS